MTYTLDGRTAPLSELLGKSGHLVLTIDLTNHETGKVTVNGKERTIVTPLVTAVGVVLGDDASNVNAVDACWKVRPRAASRPSSPCRA